MTLLNVTQNALLVAGTNTGTEVRTTQNVLLVAGSDVNTELRATQNALLVAGVNPGTQLRTTQNAVLLAGVNPGAQLRTTQNAILVLLKPNPDISVFTVGVSANGVIGDVNAFAQGVILYPYPVAGYASIHSVSVFTEASAIIDAAPVIGYASMYYPSTRWFDVDTYEDNAWDDVPHQQG